MLARYSQIANSKAKTNASRMVTAMKNWNDKFFTDKPNGVFGSVAIIRCNGAVIKSSELDLEFDIPFDDDMEANEAEIIIYNLSDTTKNRLKKGNSIIALANSDSQIPTSESRTSFNPEANNGAKCPECGSELIQEGGCVICKSCGWSKCG